MKSAVLLTLSLVLGSAASVAAQAAPARPAAPGRAAAAPGRAAAAAPDVLLGKWDFTVTSPQGEQVVTVTFERVDGVLTGQGSGQFGSFPLANIVLAGSDLSFVFKVAADGQAFDIPFMGKITGTGVAEGTATIAMAAASQSMAWKAKKVP